MQFLRKVRIKLLGEPVSTRESVSSAHGSIVLTSLSRLSALFPTPCHCCRNLALCRRRHWPSPPHVSGVSTLHAAGATKQNVSGCGKPPNFCIYRVKNLFSHT